MLKKVIILTAIIAIPLSIWIASSYGQLKEVSYKEAQSTETKSESDQAPKVIVVSTIIDASQAPSKIACIDATGAPFSAQFTGTSPESPFSAGQTVRFVGHVHGGEAPYFHATQVYAP